MLELLSTPAIEALARALHSRLYAPPEAWQRRVSELGPLAKLLDENLQPPEKLPYVERLVYDERRASLAADAPSSGQLADRYGSWKRACYAAWTLRDDGSWTEGGYPWPRFPPGLPYTREECEATVRACADDIGRIPSSHAFVRWSRNRRVTARPAGQRVRIARYETILRLLAPERAGDMDGWPIVIAKVFPQSPSLGVAAPD